MPSTHPKSFFRIYGDYVQFADRWFLDEPIAVDGSEIDARNFTQGVKYDGPIPARVPVGRPGREFAFNFGAFDMPVVSSAVAEIVHRIAPGDVERFSVSVPGARNTFQILNLTKALDCLDEVRSEFTRWQKGDHRSDLIGQYRMISTIRIDPARTNDHHLFRIENWPIALLVSSSIKEALESIPNLGIEFDPVT